MKLKTTTTVYCGCGCDTPITGADGLLLPADQLADHHVFDGEGSLDYIELFHRAHVVGRRLRDRDDHDYVVEAPQAARYEVRVTRGRVTRTTQLDAASARWAVHTAVAEGLLASCRPMAADEADIVGVQEAPAFAIYVHDLAGGAERRADDGTVQTYQTREAAQAALLALGYVDSVSSTYDRHGRYLLPGQTSAHVVSCAPRDGWTGAEVRS